jgi:hypothetical protein
MFAASKSGRVAAVATDPYFPYVPLLLETTSTNGQQNNTFLDSSTNNFTITRNGTPTQGSITPYWTNGYWSNYFNGSTDYLTVASNAALNLTADFTVETWAFATATTNAVDQVFNYGFFIFMLYHNGTSWTVEIGNGSSNYFTLTGTASLNAWHHFAITRNANTYTFWIDGASAATTTNANAPATSGATLSIARSQGSSNQWFTGYLSNFRIVKGTAVYTSAFTPSTTPLTAITNTSLLTCQSNRFRDNSTNNFTITANGTPRVQAFQPFSPTASYTAAAYGGSGYFNGSSDYLGLGSQTNLQLSNSDFTIETWIYAQGTGSMSVFGNLNSGSGSGSYWFIVNATPNGGSLLQFATGGGINVQKGTGTLSLNNWHHIAVTRNGSNIRLYLDGAQVGTTDTSIGSGTIASSGNAFAIARAGVDSALYVNGYLSNLRLVVGTALYTGSTYTVPTAPLTAVSGTQLLTNFTNAGIYDAAVQNNSITVGDAQASTTVSKWSPTSMKFDGTGDWLTAVDNPQLQLGTGDFTIDGWVYLSANGIVYGLVSKGTATTGWSVNVTVLNKLQFSYTTSNLTGTTTLATGTWYYFAVVRSGSATGNLKVYLNGSVEATSGGAVTDNFNQTNTLYIGADRVGAMPVNGYLQDVRITKGYARTITTPTAAFPTR